MTEYSFWVGSWQHIIFPEGKTADGEKFPVIRELCFGPLETMEYGVLNGGFYFEWHIIEGICEGERDLERIERERFIKVLENEVRLCKEYAPPLSDTLAQFLEKIKDPESEITS